MRCEEVARGVVPALEPVDGDAADAPLVSFELLLGDSFGMVLGEVLLGEVLVDASGDVVVLGVVVVLLLGAGGVRLTSPAEVPVTVPLGDALLAGGQSVVIAEFEDVAFVVEDMPLDGALEVVMLSRVDARPAAESALVDAVTPVPLAPFVLLRPVKRWSGLVAVVFAESVAAPVVDVELGLIVVVDE